MVQMKRSTFTLLNVSGCGLPCQRSLLFPACGLKARPCRTQLSHLILITSLGDIVMR